MVRTELILELERLFEKRVFAIVYNYQIEEGLKKGDEILFMYFIEEIIKKENVKDCVIILNGFGGQLQTAILCSSLLRNYIKRYECFVPFSIGSSLCYFVLQSDKLLISRGGILTQIDPIFSYKSEELRAIKHLSEIKDENKRILAHEMFNPVIEILKNILKKRPNIFTKKDMALPDIKRVVDLFMGGEFHESGVSPLTLEKLSINLKIIENDTIIEKSKKLINECHKELIEENCRFIIQTNKRIDEQDGGYFFS